MGSAAWRHPYTSSARLPRARSNGEERWKSARRARKSVYSRLFFTVGVFQPSGVSRADMSLKTPRILSRFEIPSKLSAVRRSGSIRDADFIKRYGGGNSPSRVQDQSPDSGSV